MRLILARHGQSESNVNPDYQGLNAPLTKIGEQQAHLLGKWLRDHEPSIGQILCSPLKRAYDTANIANEYLKLPIAINDDLEEMREFVMASLPQRKHPLQPDTEFVAPEATPYYGIYQAQVQRALDFLIAEIDRPQPMLVVSHGGTMATIMRLIMGRHDLRLNTNNTAIIDVAWSEGRWHIGSMNMTRHLPDDLLT
jgi:2,3-bisphosphoglycerate-dependent phosphoglycerate mutase